MSTSSTFENYLHVKVIGACLYEIYFLKEFMYSAEMTKTFSNAILEKKKHLKSKIYPNVLRSLGTFC